MVLICTNIFFVGTNVAKVSLSFRTIFSISHIVRTRFLTILSLQVQEE